MKGIKDIHQYGKWFLSSKRRQIQLLQRRGGQNSVTPLTNSHPAVQTFALVQYKNMFWVDAEPHRRHKKDLHQKE